MEAAVATLALLAGSALEVQPSPPVAQPLEPSPPTTAVEPNRSWNSGAQPLPVPPVSQKHLPRPMDPAPKMLKMLENAQKCLENAQVASKKGSKR